MIDRRANGASYIVAEAGKLAGVAEHLVHPHALRHAAGYSLINNDVDVRRGADASYDHALYGCLAEWLAALRAR